MALEISKVQNKALNQLATKCDKNRNGKLEKNEYNIFQSQAQKMLETKKVSKDNYMQAVKQYKSGFIGWFKDDDKVCKDTKNDGKIEKKECVKNIAQGFVGGIVKGIAKSPVKSLITIAAVTGATIATGGAILPVLAGIGVAAGGVITTKGIIDAGKATDDGTKKKAFENIGTGLSAIVLSTLGIKSANKTAAKAGVKSLKGSENANLLTNIKNGIKAFPESIKVSGKNIKGNVLTWKSALSGDNVIYANSNKLRTATIGGEFMSKANEAQAYRFDPNGNVEEVLAKNPHVEYVDGKYCVPDKWNPGQYHIIDPSREQMIMMYGADDFAVCDGNVFNGSYVNTAEFKNNGTLNYQNPTKLEYGKVVDVTKQAPGQLTTLGEGTKINTLEGVRTVEKGEATVLDYAGNPYKMPAKNVIKRNTDFSTEALDWLNRKTLEIDK